VIPVIGSSGKVQMRFFKLRLFLPLTIAVGLVTQRAAIVSIHPHLDLAGAADHWNHRDDEDYYSQPRALFQLMSPEQQQVLYENTARNMGDAPLDIKLRHIRNCYKADPMYGEGVARACNITMEEVLKQS